MTKKRLLIFGIPLLIIIIVVVVINSILSNLNSPVNGVSKTENDTQHPDTTVRVNLKPKLQNGTTISFNYPMGLTPKPSTPQTAPNLENFSYHVADITSWLLAVNVSEPRGGVIFSDSGYALRIATPATYTKSEATYNGQLFTIFSDQTANFSKVAYAMHGSRLISVALSGDDNAGSAPLQTTMTMVLNSLVWH